MILPCQTMITVLNTAYSGANTDRCNAEVDGNIVPGLGIDETAVNIIPYLNKDDGGRVSRGSFHEIKITPNDLGRIVASVNIQLFVQSRGGGDY